MLSLSRTAALRIGLATLSLLGCSGPGSSSAPASPHAAAEPSCNARQCGPQPTSHKDCGSCDEQGFEACNSGVCEATCQATACEAMSFSANTCSSASTDWAPWGAGSGTMTFTCSEDGLRCEGESDAVGCESTDEAPE